MRKLNNCSKLLILKIFKRKLILTKSSNQETMTPESPEIDLPRKFNETDWKCFKQDKWFNSIKSWSLK